MSAESFQLPEKCRNCISARARIHALDFGRDNSARAPEMVSLMAAVEEKKIALDPKDDLPPALGNMEIYMDTVAAEREHWDGYVALGETLLKEIVDRCPKSTTRDDVDIEGVETGEVQVYPTQVTTCGIPDEEWNAYDGQLYRYATQE